MELKLGGVEKIKLAAVKIDSGTIFTGNNHGEIIVTITKVNKILEVIGQEKQGFITSTNRFVGRKEAAEIAFKAGQVDKQVEGLMSEDITGNFPWAKDIINRQATEIKELRNELGKRSN